MLRVVGSSKKLDPTLNMKFPRLFCAYIDQDMTLMDINHFLMVS